MKRHMCNWAAQKSLMSRAGKDGNLGEMAGTEWSEHDDNYVYEVEQYDWYEDDYYTDESWSMLYEHTQEDQDEMWYDNTYTDEEWELFCFQKGKGKGRKGKGK